MSLVTANSKVSVLVTDSHRRNRQGYRNSFPMQNAPLFPRIHKTLETNNSIKEGCVILCLIKQKRVMGTQNALNDYSGASFYNVET